MNTSSRPDPLRCFRLVDHARHVWKGRVREVWIDRPSDDFYFTYALPSRTIGPWYECRGHVDVEGGHW